LWSTGEASSCVTVSEAGPYSVTITGADGCSSSCSVTVTDNPVGTCAITGDATICDGGSTELCAPAGAAAYLWSTGEASSCVTVSEAGPYSVTITGADGCSSSCSATVTIEENESPVITCPADVDIECGQSTLPGATGFATATDECGVPPMVSFEDRVKEGGCPQEYLIIRTWTATDESGKTMRCIQLINVHDTTPPMLSCPTDETIECRETSLFGMVTAVDECGALVEVTFVTDSIPGACDNEYTLIRTWTATDECWNTASCSSTIVVIDNTLPTLTCPAAIGPVECIDQIPAVDISLVTASDNCGTPTVIHVGDDISNQSCEDQFLLTRTYQAIDDCGKTATCTQEITVFDDTPPTLTFTNPLFTNGDTIQVQCYGQDPAWDLPEFNEGSVSAIDDCGGDITITFDRELLAGDCTEGGYINFHRLAWTATDACGNSESLLLFFALVDNTPPVIQSVPEDITVNCGEIPEAPFVYATDECLCACVVLFEETVPTSDCQDGQIIVRTWTANDDCGNVTTETQIITLVDNEAPILIGVPDVTCIGAPELNSVSAIDNCAIPSIQFTEVEIPNPCGSGMVVQRIYEASDDCGNTSRDTVILLPNNQNQPSIELVNPILLDLAPGEIPVVNCSGQYTTSFGINDVEVEDICMNGGTVFFNETLLETSDCTDGGIVAIMEVKWIVVDACGNLGERTMIVHLIDETSPVFVNFDSEVSIGCEDELPSILARDNCGEVFITMQDSIISGDCGSRYDIRRLVTATDLCGNTRTRVQTVHVGGIGPVIAGLEAGTCDGLSIPAVTAYDPCADEFVAVAMQQDTLDSPCLTGMVIERTWSAANSCGDVTEVQQTIIADDQTPPEIVLPPNSVISSFLGTGHNLVSLSQTSLLKKLNGLDADNVVVLDDCGQEVIPVFTVEVIYAEDCVEDGYFERRIYTWTGTDDCGNSSVLTFTVDIIDNIPPTFRTLPGYTNGEIPGDTFAGVPADTAIICASLPPAPEVLAVDEAYPSTMVYSESITPGGDPEEYIVTRTWVATDACGNTSTAVQTINWIPDTFTECIIMLPESVECNSHGVAISSEVPGGIGPITYEWETIGEDCFIQSGQGTPEIMIYVGWSEVDIILRVTDAYGCVSACKITLPCLFSPKDDALFRLYMQTDRETGFNMDTPTPTDLAVGTTKHQLQQLNVWPNPANGKVNLSFESRVDDKVEFQFRNLIGQTVLSDHLNVHKGFNTIEIDVSKIHTGRYLLQLKTEQEMHSRVIVIITKD
jgi:hypothetical protein